MVLVFNKNKKLGRPGNQGNVQAEMREYQTRIGLLCDIAEEANSITQVSTLLERILKVTQNTVGSSITALFLKDENKPRVHLPITVSKYADDTPRRATVIETEIADMVAGSVTALKINNVNTDPRFNPKGKPSTGFVVRSVIAAPVLKGKKVIGVIMATNKEDGSDFTDRDFEVLKGFAATEAVILLVSLEKTAIENVSSLNPALLEGYRNTVNELASTIDVKDDHVYEHARRVKDYALMAAASLSLKPGDLQAIEFGALLHDIGKIGIDSEILRKPGPLSDEEWNIVYTHPQKGADILKDIPHLKDAMNIVLCHHEKYDGTGYPKKLKGEEIPIGARLVAVANAFDTMITDHPYRAALTVTEALKELVNDTGAQFCPKSIEAFISAFNKQGGNRSSGAKAEDTRARAAGPTPSRITQVQTESRSTAENLVIKVKKDAKELKKLKQKAEKQASEARARDEKEAREAKIRAFKAAKLLKIKTEKEAKEAKIRAVKDAKEAKVKARKDAEAAKLLKIKTEREAREARIRAEKEAREAKIRAQKEAREAKARAQKEAEAAKRLKIKAEKEAKEAKIRAAREAREAEAAEKARAQKEAEAARLLKIKAEKEARESLAARIRAEKEAKEAEEARVRKDAEAAQLLKIKAEKEVKESKILAEREAKDVKEAIAQKDAEAAILLNLKADKEAKEARIQAEREAKESREAEKARAQKKAEASNLLKIKLEKEAKTRAESETQKVREARESQKASQAEKERKAATSKLDAEVLKGNIPLVVPLSIPAETARRFGRYMEKIEGVKIIMLSHSEDEGHLFLLGLQRPMTLMRLIKDIPLVANVDKKGGTILVSLNEDMIF